MAAPREVMAALVSTFNSHDLESYLTHYADSFQYELVGAPPTGDVRVVGRIIQALETAMPDHQLIADHIVADAARAVFVGRWTGTQTGPLAMSTGQTLAPGGRRFDTWFVMTIECEGGKVVRHQDFFDRGELIRQLTSGDATADN